MKSFPLRTRLITWSSADSDNHAEKLRSFLRSKNDIPENLMVLDFVKPRSGEDPAYPMVKYILSQWGYLSQFVNFAKHRHDDRGADPRKSGMVLQGVARQVRVCIVFIAT